jgi:hypothetical protein
LLPQALTARLAHAVLDLAARNIPEVFAFVYDEFWQVFASAGRLYGALLGYDHAVTPSEIWVFHVPTGRSAAGWAPHRDMGSTQDTIRSDGTPAALTVWIPLTDATPLNGCMYVLPESMDEDIQPQRLKLPRPTLELLQCIRALPAPAGSVLGWNTRVLHWGGRSSDQAEQPRIAVGIYLQSRDLDFNQLNAVRENSQDRTLAPLTWGPSMALPFPLRLYAIGQALKLYGTRSPVDFDELTLALEG